MPKAIPDGLTRQHVINALSDLDSNFEHSFGDATGYQLVHDEKAYAPKAVVGIAFRHLNGEVLHHREFSGGEDKGQANFVLRELGFEVVQISTESSLSYLLTWNPSNWNDWDFDDVVSNSKSGMVYTDQWSTGNRTNIYAGERVYLMRQGDHQGLIGSGYTISDGFVGEHWDGSARPMNAVYVDLDIILPVKEVLNVTELSNNDLGIKWNSIYASGNSVPVESASKLEAIWQDHLKSISRSIERIPNEIVAPTRYVEGAVSRVYVNRYERDSKARDKCIETWGLNCVVCGFNFESNYGELGKGFIHVHHLRDLASIGEEYEVNPDSDLRPVCPNCHAMLHRKKEIMTIEQLQQLIQ